MAKGKYNHEDRYNLWGYITTKILNIAMLVLTALSIISIILVVNLQDSQRDLKEDWSPSVVYIIIMWLLCIFLALFIVYYVKNKYKWFPVLSLIPWIATIIVGVEGSIWSSFYYESGTINTYVNVKIVSIFNRIWIISVFITFAFSLLLMLVKLIMQVNRAWHWSVAYRARCFRRLARINVHYQKGIICKADYEKVERDLLRYVHQIK